MTTDSSGNKLLHPFFTKMQPKTTYKRSLPVKSHSDPPVHSTAIVPTRSPQKENKRPVLRKPVDEPCPAESSTSAAKRYAKYRETLRDQRRQEQIEAILDANPLSLEEQLYLDFYGPEDEPTPQQQQRKREPMWPDRNVFRGGHVRQVEDEEMFASIEPLPLRQNTLPHVRDIIANEGTAFFQTMANRRKKQDIEPSPKKKQVKGKQKLDFSRDSIEQMMDEVYRESEWKEIPACQALFNTLFDEQEHNDLPWTEKYRPRTVDGLLGDHRGFNYMLDWLRRLKVSCREDEPRRKIPKHDSSPELSMDDLTLDDDDDDSLPPSDDSDDSDFEMVSRRPRKRTRKEPSIVRSNLMLIFGGCGVGKTASVYTIAQQLGYEVFEINAGMRRAGKDVMAAVGEMTESHQVNFAESADIPSIFDTAKKRPQSFNGGGNKKKRRTEKKPKGSIMSHFARISIKPDEEESDDMDVDIEDDEERAPAAKQFLGPTRQSLILLEEVDLLYEDDKGFWTAVQELAQKSKRPIIMTCNDTDMVPTETLKLEKAIHIAPQTTSNLMPYLQLLCFKEGYVVDPSDLLYLVAVMGSDLRQLIHTLEVWCKQADDLSKSRRFRTCTGLFSQYMATESDDLAWRLATDIQPEDIDLYELCQLSKRMEPRRRAITVQEFFGSDLLATYRALETAAFSDTWITRQANQYQIVLDESEGKDQVSGYDGTISIVGSAAVPELVELDGLIQGLNHKRVQHHKWRAEIQEGAGIWGGLCYTRTTAYNECSEALRRILNWRLASNPVCSVIMAEYVPYIRAMCQMQAQQQSGRRKRASRRKQHLKLGDDCIELLQRERAMTNLTHQWHSQAAAYGDRWKKAAAKS